jgi:hypothetical protein
VFEQLASVATLLQLQRTRGPNIGAWRTAISVRDFAGLRVFKDSCLLWVKGSDSDLVEELVEEARCQCGEVLSTHIGSGASRLTLLGSREVVRHA